MSGVLFGDVSWVFDFQMQKAKMCWHAFWACNFKSGNSISGVQRSIQISCKEY